MRMGRNGRVGTISRNRHHQRAGRTPDAGVGRSIGTGSAAGPASHQKGTVTLKGHDGLRALAAMTVATTERPAEEGSNPVRFCLLPWALCLGKVT